MEIEAEVVTIMPFIDINIYKQDCTLSHKMEIEIFKEIAILIAT